MRFLRDETAQGMVEYGLILTLISVVAILALSNTAGTLEGILDEVSAALSSISSS